MPLDRQRKCVSAKLADEGLQRALAKALGVVRHKSEVALSELQDSYAWMEELGRRRLEHLTVLPELVQELERHLEEAGTHVLWASDGAEACRLVVELAGSRGVKNAILSKSMVGEEVGIEGALERAGIAATQTDLGERVVQVAGQRPSHVTAPCIHMSAVEIGELLARKLGMAPTSNAEEISRFLAWHLRPAFLEAHLGISGVNLAVSSTGQLVMVENEGNVRMGYTLPKVHVVLLGMEKVVPCLEDALDILEVLPRVATGQRASSYVSWVAPKPLPGQERFVVLVDNGRTAAYGSALHRRVLACIRCGRCMNVCPVYERVGGHAYGWTYPGPIGLALAPYLAPPEVQADVMNLCTLCGACSEACPVRIPLDTAIAVGRSLVRCHMEPQEVALQRKLFHRVAWAWSTPGRYRWTHRAHRLGVRWFPRKVHQVEKALGWAGERVAPRPAATLFRTWWEQSGRIRYRGQP